jgi:transposase
VSSDVHEALGKALQSAGSGSSDSAPPQADFPPSGTAPAVAEPPGAVPQIKPLSPRKQAQEAKRQQRIQQYQRIGALHAAGLSLRKIARAVGVSVKRVIRYVRAEHCPDWNPGQQRPTQLDRFAAVVDTWITQGGRNAAELYRKLLEQGCRASYDAVRRFVNRRLGSTGRPGPRVGPVTPPAAPAPSARQLSFAIIRREEERTEEQQGQVERLQAGTAALQEGLRLAASFAALLRKTAKGTLGDWLALAEGSECIELRSFATSLRQDEAAVVAASMDEWSNGATEGHINRLKLLQRSMYGRAGLPLLRARVRLAS